MNLGQKLLDLRKKKNLSQEEAAEKLHVSRQTISKWETSQSTPDFDKLASICKLYQISADDLINNDSIFASKTPIKKNNRNIWLGIGIFLYFIAVIWIIVSIPTFKVDAILATAIFILICGIATVILICMETKIPAKDNLVENNKKENPLLKIINSILSLITLIVYLTISIISMAWNITWIIWIIYALILEIIKLIFTLKGENYEK